MISLIWGYKNKEKTEGADSSRITKPKNTQIVTKERKTGVDGLECRDNGGEKAGIMISMYNVRLAQGRLDNTAETSSESTAPYYVDSQ